MCHLRLFIASFLRRWMIALLGGLLLLPASKAASCQENWKQRFPTTNPTGRQQHGLAYDVKRGVTVLFGGYVCSPRTYVR